MFTTKSLLIIACIVVSTSLFGQPVSEDITLYGPTISETMDQIDVISTYVAPVSGNDEAHVLTPDGTVALTSAAKLAAFIDKTGQAGVFRFYFPLTGLRTQLTVE